MASSTARRLCPDLVILPGRFDRYEEYSSQFHDVLDDVTWCTETLGLDEAFLDLRPSRRVTESPLTAAREVRRRLREELHLECGVGVARNKLFAKLGSKRAKPRFSPGGITPGPGVLWVTPDVETAWLEGMPVRELWGVGPATERKLARLGISQVSELRRVEVAHLATHLGDSLARTLAQFARGEDSRGVESSRGAKSVGHEETFAVSVSEEAEIRTILRRQAGIVARALRDRHLLARRVTVIARDDELRTRSHSQTLSFGIDDADALAEVAMALGVSVERSLALRLLGVHASQLEERVGSSIQLSLDLGGAANAESSEEASRRRQVDREALRDTIDDIRRRFGANVLGRASEMERGALRLRAQRSESPFGPATEEP
jgi:DNA polymerase-4